LGQSPLRLVCSRTEQCKGCYEEVLECGHRVTTFQDFVWDEKSHLVNLPMTAKRRRCHKCRDAAAIPIPRKPVQSVPRDFERKIA